MTRTLIADSSFYICFLEDITSPNFLKKILKEFTAQITPTILEELKKSKKVCPFLKNKKSIKIFKETGIDFGAPLRPLLSTKEIRRGEHELIIFAYFCYNLNHNFILIIDERGVIKFIEKNLPYLKESTMGTIGFIGCCYYTYSIFTQQEALNLLDKISQSKFRVTPEIISKVKHKIMES